MERPRVFLFLRIAVTALCLTACVLLIALWVRSHYFEDRASGKVPSVGLRLYSSRGWIVLYRFNAMMSGPHNWDVSLGSEYWLSPDDARLRFSLPVSFFGGPAASNISLPHWAVILAVLVASATAWMRWNLRFSLRTLLIATTLVAVGLGIAAMSR